MASRMSDWEVLNGYVDGELDPTTAAHIAERIAREPRLARQVANLTAMKAALAQGGGVPDFDFGPPAGRANRGWQWGAMAAAVTLVLAGLSQWSLPTHSRAPAWLVAGAQAHARLLEQAPAVPPSATLVSAMGGFQPYLPDLAAAKLTLAAVAPLNIDVRREGVAFQYTGTRGCRVTYLAFSGAEIDFDENLGKFELGGLRGYGWRVGDIGYALLAEGMDSGRLTVIAKSVHTASRLHRPFDAETRDQLAQSRADSRACAV